MPLTPKQLMSLMLIGIMAGGLFFQCILAVLSRRKNINIIIGISHIAMIFIMGFNNQFGMLTNAGPDDELPTYIKYGLFFATNIYVLCINFVFAIMPRFRKVSRPFMVLLSAVVLLVCTVHCFINEKYDYILIAILLTVHLVYFGYVARHIFHTFDKRIISSYTVPVIFMLYIVFVVWTAIHAIENKNDIWFHFMLGSLFSVLLSSVDVFRRYTSFKVGNKTATSVEIQNRIDELESSNTSKDKFFSIIAHDLKSPISSIRTLSEIYSEEAEKSQDPHSRDLAETLSESIKSLCQLLDDLLTWSRSQLGTVKFSPMYINIEDLADNIKQVMHPLCISKRITLKVSIKGRDKMYGDPNMIQTILRNLLTNAIKFSYSDSLVMLEFDAEGFKTVIRVIDNGIGMSQKELDNLFKIDKISSKPGTQKERGTGLGLIVCEEFVKKHSGTIEVETEENLGTSFIIKLPFNRYNNLERREEKRKD